MEPSPTELFLPSSFPYPIKISSIDATNESLIERGTRLLSYSFVYLPHAPGSQPETRFGTWDSAVEGTLESWNFKAGDVISQRRAKEKPAAIVIEPCKHGMQLGGLCVLCGKDMTNSDYIGFSDASRASIQMTHSANGPTVSLEEAQRIERETAQRLLKDRKLSLIVDLDQTIVHATVDPTVGEWISEGEAWEARRAEKGSTDPDDPEDECNPNWEALKDVKKFRLGPETLGSASRGKGRAPTAVNKGVENDGCIYYIKPRPGWKEFLENVSTKYEMHVYTMGTRAYAEEVCAAIDPEGKAFGGRLLSRDESGSLTQKSLQRLFPCDTSMVVIIDDRADVWEWSPNLIKVIPYDFFVGIGDINSTFLPKVEPLTVSTSLPSTAESTNTSASASALATPPPSQEELERSEIEAKAMLSKNSETLDAQMKERPLAKRQEELLEEKAESDGSSEMSTPSPDSDRQESKAGESSQQEKVNTATPSKVEKTPRKALLKNDDAELSRVNKLLDEIHHTFFAEYEARSTKTTSPSHPHRRKSTSSHKHEAEKPAYDVTRIIPSIRSDVLKGVHLLFSSVIPLDTRPESTEIWRMALMFGAKCYTDLTPDITHVVAAKRGTVKVDMARRRGGIKIVWVAWFTDSVALWKRQDETPYLLDDPPIAGPSTSPTLSLHPTSSDLDLDEDEDWELETSAVGGGVSLGTSGSFQANQINWDDINDEVEAAMMESDDEEEMSEKSGMRSGNVSEEEWTDESNSVVSSVNNTPKSKRKRLRSLTPSESGINGGGGDPDGLRSPLSKRKKLAADRSGFSKLKVAINADDLQSGEDITIQERSEDGHSEKGDGGSPGKTSSGMGSPTNDDLDNDDDDEDEDEEPDDDFLARELEEEWG